MFAIHGIACQEMTPVPLFYANAQNWSIIRFVGLPISIPHEEGEEFDLTEENMDLPLLAGMRAACV